MSIPAKRAYDVDPERPEEVRADLLAVGSS